MVLVPFASHLCIIALRSYANTFSAPIPISPASFRPVRVHNTGLCRIKGLQCIPWPSIQSSLSVPRPSIQSSFPVLARALKAHSPSPPEHSKLTRLPAEHSKLILASARAFRSPRSVRTFKVHLPFHFRVNILFPCPDPSSARTRRLKGGILLRTDLPDLPPSPTARPRAPPSTPSTSEHSRAPRTSPSPDPSALRLGPSTPPRRDGISFYGNMRPAPPPTPPRMPATDVLA